MMIANYGKKMIALLLFTMASTGCSGYNASLNLNGFPNPVLVGPVTRIAETRPINLKEEKVFSTFSTEASFVHSASGSSGYENHGGTIYHVTKTSSATSYQNSSWIDLQRATANRQDLVLFVDELQAGNFGHVSLVGIVTWWVKAEGKIYDLASSKGGAK